MPRKRKYEVPVTAIYSGHITVEATSKKDAIAKANEAWKGIESIEAYTFDVDIADDPNDVELAEK